MRLLLVLCAWPVVATAMELNPDPATLQRVVTEGTEIARVGNGYSARQYVIYEVADARDIDPGLGNVDAIVLLTPLERLRHEAYMETLGGRSTSATEGSVGVRFNAGEVGIRVFAHGSDVHDEGFLQRFSTATLQVGREILTALRIDRTTPSIGVYPLARAGRERTVGTITYWFDVASVPGIERASGTLSVRDASGRQLAAPVDFALRP